MDRASFEWLMSPSFHNQALTAGLWWFLGSLGYGAWYRHTTFPLLSCGHLIRWQHNLPIVGWLILGGRCYDCGTRISPKHAIVEALAAALFVMAAIASPWL